MSGPVDFSETFVQEADELLENVEECILDIENDPNDMDAVNRLFRSMHTIKGSGAMFGFDDIASFTHHVETALDQVREGNLSVNKELIDLVLASRDQIKAMLLQAQGGPGVDQKSSQVIIDSLEDLIPRVPEEATVSDELKKMQEEKPSESVFRVRFHPDPGIFA